MGGKISIMYTHILPLNMHAKNASSLTLQTLHDLMDETELESLTPATGNSAVSMANRKKRNLEENMRREAEERLRKKKELMMREMEYEKV